MPGDLPGTFCMAVTSHDGHGRQVRGDYFTQMFCAVAQTVGTPADIEAFVPTV